MPWFGFLNIALKLLVVFICIILFLKVTGKTSLSQMTSIDFIGNMILGGIAGGVIYNPGLTVVDFLIVIAMWTTIMYISNLLKRHSHNAKAFIVGNPTILMEEGKINLDALNSSKLDMSGFSTLLRMQGVPTISLIDKALLEPNGQLTLVKKGDKGIAVIVLVNEEPDDEGLKEIKKDQQWLKSELKKQGYDGFEGLFCVEFYDNQLFVIPCTLVETNDTAKTDKSSQAQKKAAKKNP